MNSPGRQNKLRSTLASISANLNVGVNRMKAAMMMVRAKLGFLPRDSVTYRHVCPKGAGAVERGAHTMENRHLRGSRRAQRRSAKMMRDLEYTEWGQRINEAAGR